MHGDTGCKYSFFFFLHFYPHILHPIFEYMQIETLIKICKHSGLITALYMNLSGTLEEIQMENKSKQTNTTEEYLHIALFEV